MDTWVTDKFTWSVNVKLIQEELLAWICVGSFINWEKPFEDVNVNNFNPSLVFISSDHQEEHLELKSPLITDKDGLRLIISFKTIWKLEKNASDLSLVWLGER